MLRIKGQMHAWLWLWILSACTSPAHDPVEPAFYHWQSRVELAAEESRLLDRLNASRLYLRCFDLKWDPAYQEVIPVGSAIFPDDLRVERDWVPTVFLTNDAVGRLDPAQLDTLARRTVNRLFYLSGKVPGWRPGEIQLDCDWTRQTREAYFRFLRLVKNYLPEDVQLSTTIRLHQYRYPRQTGVPPADRGMLMCYNVESLKNPAARNSILSLERVKPYFSQSPGYPLPLDLALPIYAWGVHYRDGELLGLINDLRPEDLRDTARFEQRKPGRYQIIKSTYLKGYYLYRGDELRIEEIQPALLDSVARWIAPRFSRPEYVTFYHLDTANTKYFTYDQLQRIVQIFRSR